MSSPSPGEPASALPRSGVLALTAATLLTALLIAAGASASGALSRSTLATVSPVPKSCPSRSVIRAALHVQVRHVVVQAGPLNSTVTNGFSPPTAQNKAKNTGYERTCTYSTTAAPVTISFVAPVTTKTFNQSRKLSPQGRIRRRRARPRRRSVGVEGERRALRSPRDARGRSDDAANEFHPAAVARKSDPAEVVLIGSRGRRSPPDGDLALGNECCYARWRQAPRSKLRRALQARRESR